MKYSLIFIIALSVSLTASAGFLDKVKKGVNSATKVAGDVLDPEAAEQKKQEAPRVEVPKQTEGANVSDVKIQKNEKVVAGEKVDEEAQKKAEKQKQLQALKDARSGVVVYAPRDIQWGDSKESLWRFCGFDRGWIEEIGYHVTVEDGSRQGRHVETFVHPDVGVSVLTITFFSNKQPVTAKQIKDKYIKKYGEPKKTENGFVWSSSDEIVELSFPSTYLMLPVEAQVVFRSPDMNQKMEAANKKREEAAKAKEKEHANELLDF